MATETLTIDGVFRDLISNQVKRVAGSFKTLGYSTDSVFKGMLKFASAEKIFAGLGKVAGVVWKDVLASSPQVSKQVEQIKEKLSVLVGTLTQTLIPVFTSVFKFLLDNWNKIRFGFELGIAVIKDAFNGLLGAFQMMASGFFVAIGGIASALSKFGLVSKETVEGFNKSAEDLATKAVANFSKVGATVDVVKGGIEGLGKEVKATYDIFGDNKKLQDFQKAIDENNEKASDKAEEMAKKSKAIIERQLADEREMIEEENSLRNELLSRIEDDRIALMEEQGGKELEVLQLKEEKERQELIKSKSYRLLVEEDKQKAIANIEGKYNLERSKREKVLQTNQVEAAAAGMQGYADLLAQGASNYKDYAKEAQYIAQVQAGINSYLAFTSTLATVQPTVPLGIIAAGGVLAQGLATQNKIAQQSFAEGGFPKGRNVSVLVNEDGQEAILNPTATRNLGRDNINALNAGGSLSNNVSFGGNTINIYGNADPIMVKKAVDQSYAEKIREAKALIAGAKRRGVKV